MIKLGVNIDHVATLRQARYADMMDSPNCEPDILAAASACERAGADGITVHLRADRRHIQDRDVFRLRTSIMTKLNLEMGNTPEILETALRVVPDEVCLVPENRQEVTTEGGLNVVKHFKALNRRLNAFTPRGSASACSSNRKPIRLKPRPNWRLTLWNCTRARLRTYCLTSRRTNWTDLTPQPASLRRKGFW